MTVKNEIRLLLRDGPVKYARVLYRVHRFHKAVQRMIELEGYDD